MVVWDLYRMNCCTCHICNLFRIHIYMFCTRNILIFKPSKYLYIAYMQHILHMQNILRMQNIFAYVKHVFRVYTIFFISNTCCKTQFSPLYVSWPRIITQSSFFTHMSQPSFLWLISHSPEFSNVCHTTQFFSNVFHTVQYSPIYVTQPSFLWCIQYPT